MALQDPLPHNGNAATALGTRYGVVPDAVPDIAWNDTIERLLSHRSVRAYRTEPLPDRIEPTLVAAAQSAASSSNLQLWSVVAVRDAERRKRLAELAGGQQHIIDAPLILVWVADLARAQAIAGREGRPVEGFTYLESFLVASVDAALAAQNAVIAAESLGLGTVYIGALRNRPEEVADTLGLPSNAAALFGLVVGWPDEERPAAVKPRLPQAAVLHRETYALDQRETWDAYDETSRAFQRSQGLDPVGWISQLLTRGRSAASLNGRERLGDALRKLGFGLK
jgi:nitroreductase